MFVVVHHQITDRTSFFGAASSVIPGAPNAKPVQFFPSETHDQAVCLWEAESVQAVQSFLEPKLGNSSRNTYYAVDASVAIGLPGKAATA